MLFQNLPYIIFHILRKMFENTWSMSRRNSTMSIHRNQIVMRNILSFIIIFKFTKCNIIGFWYACIFHVLYGFSPCTSNSYN